MKKTWTIYCHRNKINNKRYIGQTNKKNLNERWRNGKGYAPKNNENQKNHRKFYNAIQKYGWDNFEHIVLEENIQTLEEANQKEQYWITYYDTFNSDKGYNMTPGGDNHLLDFEAKERLRQTLIQTYKTHPEKVRYQRQKQAEISGKPIYCFELNKIYSSISEAARENNVDASAISRCLQRKKQLTTNGLHWKYNDEDITIKEIEKSRKKSNKKVLCVETNMIYNSPKEASEKTKFDSNAIAKCCRGINKTHMGYHWGYIDE